MIRKNPQDESPRIDKSSYIDPSCIIIGNVTIGRKVFVGPGAVIRADEQGSKIVINDFCNVQDNVIVHALAGTKVEVDVRSSLSHGCVIHGPVRIGKKCFIGFGSVVFGSTLEDGVTVKYCAVVENSVIKKGLIVDSCMLINSPKKASALKKAPGDAVKFAANVARMNLKLLCGYKKAKHI